MGLYGPGQPKYSSKRCESKGQKTEVFRKSFNCVFIIFNCCFYIKTVLFFIFVIFIPHNILIYRGKKDFQKGSNSLFSITSVSQLFSLIYPLLLERF